MGRRSIFLTAGILPAAAVVAIAVLVAGRGTGPPATETGRWPPRAGRHRWPLPDPACSCRACHLGFGLPVGPKVPGPGS